MVTLATLPLKVGTVDNSGFIHYNESGVDKKLTVNDFLAKIASQYSTDINAFLASLSSIAGLDSLNKKGADIASATTTNLDTATGNYINITGTTTITGITLAEGKQRLVRFTGALILTHGANLVLPNASNITTATGDFALFVGDAGGVVRCVGYFRTNTLATESLAGISKLPKQITVSNGTDTDHDLDFTAGNAQADDGSLVFSVGALTKQIDAAWAVGTNQGGLDTGAVANNTPYYIYAIYNPTSGVSDILFTATKGSPTMPSGYTKKCYIGALYTDGSGNIRSGTWFFHSNGSYLFLYDTEISDISTTITASLKTATITAPPLTWAILSHKHTTIAAFSTEVNCSYKNLVTGVTNLVSSNRSLGGESNVNRNTQEILLDSNSQFQFIGNDANAGNILAVTRGWKELL